MNQAAACLSLLLTFTGMAGCTTFQPHMIPTPAVFRDARLDMAVRLPAELRSTEVPVFYATTRAPVDPGKPGHYTDSAGDGVMLGKALVRLGPPGWKWEDLLASDRIENFLHGCVAPHHTAETPATLEPVTQVDDFRHVAEYDKGPHLLVSGSFNGDDGHFQIPPVPFRGYKGPEIPQLGFGRNPRTLAESTIPAAEPGLEHIVAVPPHDLAVA